MLSQLGFKYVLCSYLSLSKTIICVIKTRLFKMPCQLIESNNFATFAQNKKCVNTYPIKYACCSTKICIG